jgi:hypothetical protein
LGVWYVFTFAVLSGRAPEYDRHLKWRIVQGTVTDIRIAGETRSFGFIEYSTAEEATQGLALNGMIIKGVALLPFSSHCTPRVDAW